MGLGSFRDLKVWQSGMDLAERVYAFTRGFPKEERYGLSSQMQRAAVSVPANIAEGHAQGSTRAYLRHLGISMGSLAELETQLLLAHRLRYLKDEQLQGVSGLLNEVGRMLRGLQKSIKRRLDDDSSSSP